jgi:hypothetical protein
MQKYRKKKEKVKKKRNALWITVVIHGAFGCGETMISQHLLERNKIDKYNFEK